ncbi:MAG: cobyrinate a,c-diamide synthase [Desulfovibrionaceae bacterium]|nr:cobyrinate a,c-diamide synthase [Desulfovibrionaceae bacterium]
MNIPRLVISGLSGGSGKTLLSLGLARAWARQGLVVQPCKKGPDYIDAAWLALAARRAAANLDPWFLPPEALRTQFARACGRTAPAELALIEGNRGLYDGRDVTGSCSTAQVALTLSAPVLLTLNCAKMTRTAAALVAGITAFEPDLHVAGVVLNNVASPRHATQVRQAVETYTDTRVYGELPRLSANPLPERHMGLSLRHAAPEQDGVLERLADYAEEHVDLPGLLDLARNTAPLPDAGTKAPACRNAADGEPRPRIGFVRDDALWFYYEENLEALTEAGAELVELSVLDPAPWPALDGPDGLDGLYLGGGFPELYAREIAASPHLADIRALSEAWRPVYAECGGFMILCRALCGDAGEVPMAGLLPARTRFFPRPQGLGYVEAVTVGQNPFHPRGSVWRGHEFHYSRCEMPSDDPAGFALRLDPGTGMGRFSESPAEKAQGHDGLCVRNTFAAYTHVFAPAAPHWALNFAAAARTARTTRDRAKHALPGETAP